MSTLWDPSNEDILKHYTIVFEKKGLMKKKRNLKKSKNLFEYYKDIMFIKLTKSERKHYHSQGTIF